MPANCPQELFFSCLELVSAACREARVRREGRELFSHGFRFLSVSRPDFLNELVNKEPVRQLELFTLTD